MTHPTPAPALEETAFVLSLDSPQADLATAGGKGANLARLVRAGFPVPGGFIVTTRAYRDFVQANGLADWIQEQVRRADPEDPKALEAASQAIRRRFLEGTMPEPIRRALLARYQAMGRPAVAVRSSATAEDLPDLSFAGQQDTYLNVVGEEALARAVIRCWSSLWTARAMGYRARNQLDQADVSLAVVVQEMVQSQASGVLFTANPLNGRRTEAVIDATLGLGEALVAGLVEPDHYVVRKADGRILEKRLGAKSLAIRSAPGGDTVTEEVQAQGRQALPDQAIRELVALGNRVEALFGSPQDIEWAWVEGQLFLLQSRPITSLYPLPPGVAPEPLRVFFSFGAVQGVLAPFTPLGQETIKAFFAGGASLFGYRFTPHTQPVILSAGERLWADITPPLRNGLGRRLVARALAGVEPGSGQILAHLLQDSRLAPARAWPRWETLARLLRFALPRLREVAWALLHPERAQIRAQSFGAAAIREFRERSARATTLSQRVALHEYLGQIAFPVIVPVFLAPVLAGYLPLVLLNKLVPDLAQADPEIGPHTVLTLTRGLPHNVTTEMDLALWETAQAIRQDPQALAHFLEASPEQLAGETVARRLPVPAQAAVERFLERYGMRGVGEIDVGRPRWWEDPLPVIQTLRSYLGIQDEAMSPAVVFRRGEAEARAAQEKLVAAARRRPLGRLKARFVRWATRRIRTLAGLRESPKFTIITLMGISRRNLLASGEELVRAGVLERRDDPFFLNLPELHVLGMGAPGRWRELVQERREAIRREERRRQIPRILLSDGEAFYQGMVAAADEASARLLVGSPVSPGVAEGVAHVVFQPHQAQLKPGEILVCPGTDPAWTPLFLAAAGLVMEVGGMMTHGAVVAREYGIPAVVGVDRATQRIKTGQRIRVDGSSGKIWLLNEPEEMESASGGTNEPDGANEKGGG